MDDIDALVKRAQDLESSITGRHDAFDELVRRFQDMAFGYAYAALGDIQLAEDVTQETFLAAYRYLHQLQDAKAFPGWLRRILMTQCNRVRRTGRAHVALLDVGDLQSMDDPPAIAEAHELHATVVTAIRSLPAHERRVMMLFVINHYSPGEIAQFLEVPASTVRKQLQRARTRLQERLVDMAREEFYRWRPSKDDQFAQDLHLWSAFDTVAAEADLTVLELLLIDGMEIDVRDDAGRTLLMRAVQQGHIDAAELLLRHGATVHLTDHVGKTPLMYARERGLREIEALIQRYVETT